MNEDKNAVARPALRREVLGALLARPEVFRLRPSISLFLLRYMRKFRVRRIGGNLILHSHLPPLNSRAYGRFIKEHLLERSAGPSHAQVAVTNACPQKCAFCYNRDRTGRPMDTRTILRVVGELKAAGVFWLGLTGGEPLLKRELVEITEAAADGCAVKLFTTGMGVTAGLARDLGRAGLFSVSVSLDHWKEEIHDAGRRFPGAYREALRAIDVFLGVPGLHVGVSSVLSPEMIRGGDAERLLDFLEGLGIHEAWLSEVMPSAAPLWTESALADAEDRLSLARLQDSRNRRAGMTVNYLGHFEGPEHFGCNAGRRMVYVDAFGEVSPCVFTPMTFGNVRDKPLRDIIGDMGKGFRPSSSCFLRENYRLLEKYAAAGLPLDRERSGRLVAEAGFGPPGEFLKRFEKAGSPRKEESHDA
jgi:MoaA/NifB/PqqE/SkfB family radical SAM enzyme